MEKVHKADFEAIRAAVKAATPEGWRYTLRAAADGRVVMEVQRAPVDLLAFDLALYGGDARGYAKVNPSGYEDRADSAIGGIWRALHSRNTVEFDAGGERAGRWYIPELWLGHWKRPFVLAQ